MGGVGKIGSSGLDGWGFEPDPAGQIFRWERKIHRNEEAEERDGVDHFKHSCGAVRAHLRTESYPIPVISPVQIFLLRIKGR